ncbi:MAG TPA: hypothetical protein PKH80_03115 [Methanofastidiosum sp.]|nr:hypothetical protein [Methanofastidiosum sp.]
MLKKFSKNSNIKEQIRLVNSLEGIGDILTFETAKKNDKYTKEYLPKIEEIIKNIFDMKSSNPDKFKELSFSQEFLDYYKKNKSDAILALSFSPEKYLKPFSTAVNQLTRIHQISLISNNDEISYYATHYLIRVLKYVSSVPKNDTFIELIFKALNEMTLNAIKNKDYSMYGASILWYKEVVFDRFDNYDFELSYLELFDNKFFNSVKMIISKDQDLIYERLVESFSDYLMIGENDKELLYKIYEILIQKTEANKLNNLENEYKVGKRIEELNGLLIDIDLKEKLDLFLKEFDIFIEKIKIELDEETQKELFVISNKIKKAAKEIFKFNNFLETIFGMCAFCIFKKRPDYINFLWEYVQPKDSDAHWIANDLTPSNIKDLLKVYYRLNKFDRRFHFWERHHGAGQYLDDYFLLRLAKLLEKEKTKINEMNFQESYLYSFDIYQLKNISHSVDTFIERVNKLKKEIKLLEDLGFQIDAIDETFDNKTITFLNKLKQEALKKIQNLHMTQRLNSEKIAEFENEFLQSFNEQASLRKIFKCYNLYCDKTQERNNVSISGFGINTLDDKAVFFDKWYVFFDRWGSSYGGNLANSENQKLFEDIIKCCEESKHKKIEDILESFENLDDMFILINFSIYRSLYKSNNFKSKNLSEKVEFDLDEFVGYYQYKKAKIPVFRVMIKNNENTTLFLNKSKLGRLIQYSPLNEKEEKSLKDIFYINIKDLSEDPEILENYILNPSKQLKEIGNKEKQIEYLKTRVIVTILEKFSFEKDANFEGIILKLNEDG